MRCRADGRFMQRLTPGGRWWLCSCQAIRCSDPSVDFGLMLMGFHQRGGVEL